MLSTLDSYIREKDTYVVLAFVDLDLVRFVISQTRAISSSDPILMAFPIFVRKSALSRYVFAQNGRGIAS